MKAAVLEATGSPLEIKDIKRPDLGAKEVLVKVHYATINHRDIYISKGQYANIQNPSILGSDGSGTIEEVGGAVSEDWIGKEVLLNPNINWGESEAFQANNYQILGMPTAGTFAEFVSVDVNRIYLKPEHLTLKEAAAIPLAGLTAYRALFTRGNLQENQKVLINGIGGGVAQFAFLFALANGNETFVTSGNNSKIEKAKALGAAQGFNYKEENWSKSLLKDFGGVDLAIDSAGGEGFNNLVKAMNPGGTIVTYGGTRGKVNGLSPQIVFWKQLNILGTTMGSDADFKAMVNFVEKQKIVPQINTTFKLEAINEAFNFIENQSQFGKVIIEL